MGACCLTLLVPSGRSSLFQICNFQPWFYHFFMLLTLFYQFWCCRPSFYLLTNRHKTSSLCNIIFVIFTCFHLMNFLEKKNLADCLLKKSGWWKHNFLVKCSVLESISFFLSVTLFLDGSWVFLIQKNCQMKAGQKKPNKFVCVNIVPNEWSLVRLRNN